MDGDVRYDETMHELGSPLIQANVAAMSKSENSPHFAQLQRPRSPVAAASADGAAVSGTNEGFSEVTYVPMATAGPCYTNCQMVMPFMVLLFFMTLLVAVTQVD